MNDESLLRYSRQIMLPEIDAEGQQTLVDSHVIIVGLGGLGSPVAMYLAAAGVGKLTLVDFDHIELHNLQRQIAHDSKDIDRNKAESAANTCSELNPETKLDVIKEKLEEDQLSQLAEQADAIVDCTDNFTTRFMLNRVSVATKTPLISGAAIRFEGQLTAYDPRQEESPCYRCLYDETGQEDAGCTTNGVLAPVVGVIGSLQAVETIKILTGAGKPLVGKLMLWDGLYGDFRQIKLKKDPKCPCCRNA